MDDGDLLSKSVIVVGIGDPNAGGIDGVNCGMLGMVFSFFLKPSPFHCCSYTCQQEK